MSERSLIASASQTIGPFYAFALTTNTALGVMAQSGAIGERIELVVHVVDGESQSVADAMVELWQADASGKYQHPEDMQARNPDPAFSGFGRLGTNAEGEAAFTTVKPGRVAGPDGGLQAPHINVIVFARGVLLHLYTRIYFAGDPANKLDSVLAQVPEERRSTLLAYPDRKRRELWRFEIRLCGEGETVFFDW